jgi:hypothetical protein
LRPLTAILLFCVIAVQSYSQQYLHAVKENRLCLYGLKDAQNKWVVKPQYTLCEPANKLTDFGWIIYKNGKMGCLDKTGKIIIPPVYNDLRANNQCTHFVFADSTDRYGFMVQNENIIIPAKYDKIETRGSNEYVVLVKNEKYGFADLNGHILEPRFDLIQFRPTYGQAVFYQNKKYGLVNIDGEIIIPATYDHPFQFNTKGFAFTYKNKLYGVVTRTGEVIHPSRFKSLDLIKGYKIWEAKEGDLLGLMNEEGKMLLEPTLHKINKFSKNGIAICQKDSKYGVLHKSGTLHLQPQFDSIENFYHRNNRTRALEHAIFKKDGKYGVIHTSGKLVLSAEYQLLQWKNPKSREFLYAVKNDTLHIWHRTNGRMIPASEFIVFENGYGTYGGMPKYGIVKESGKIICLPKYFSIGKFTKDETAIVSVQNESIPDRWTTRIYGQGLINRSGKEIIPVKRGQKILRWRPDLSSKSGSLFSAISSGGQHGIINTKGEFLVKMEYSNIYLKQQIYKSTSGKNTTAYWVEKHGEVWGLIDEKGDYLIEPEFDYPVDFNFDGLNIFSREFKTGIIDKNGATVIPFEYESIEKVSDQLYLGNKNYKWGFFNINAPNDSVFKYDMISTELNGKRLAMKNDMLGILDNNGNVLVDFTVPNFEKFNLSLIDYFGLETIDSSAIQFSCNIAAADQNFTNGYGTVIPVQYDGNKAFENRINNTMVAWLLNKTWLRFDYNNTLHNMRLQGSQKKQFSGYDSWISDYQQNRYESKYVYKRKYKKYSESYGEMKYMVRHNPKYCKTAPSKYYSYLPLHPKDNHFSEYGVIDFTPVSMSVIAFQYYGQAYNRNSYDMVSVLNYIIENDRWKLIVLGDLFNEEAFADLSTMCYNNIADIPNFSMNCSFPEGLLNIDHRNFYISEKGIHFSFHDNRMGDTGWCTPKEVEHPPAQTLLTFREIQHLLKKDCPLKILIP